MTDVGETLAKLVLCVAMAAGCTPDIGDSCSVSDDCSSQGDRLCDTTEPGGYCTRFNCEPGSCPDEAICVAFARASLENPECNDSPSGLAGRRTFCMRSCKKNRDCRSGYECGDVGEAGNPWGATVVENRRVGTRICVVPAKTVPVADAEEAVCFGGEQSAENSGAGGADALPGMAGSAADSGGMAGDLGRAGSSASGAGGRN